MCDRQRLSLGGLEGLGNGPWKTRIAEPKQKGFARWRGDEAARRAVTNNRTRLLSGVAKEASSCAPRSSAPSPTTSIAAACAGPGFGAARTCSDTCSTSPATTYHWMRQLIGAGTPREAVAGGYGGIFVLLTPTGAMLVALGVSQSGQTVFAAAFLIWE